MDIIELEDVNFRYPQAQNNCLHNVSFNISRGDIVSLMGPNGSGKTTLLKIISGLINNFSGKVKILDKEIQKYKSIELAKIISYIPQVDNYIFDFTVAEIIAMGRRPYLNSFGILNQTDKETIEKVVNLLNLKKIIDKKYLNLSGGERRLVLIARALTQQTSILLMDEPTTYLDLSYKITFMNILQQLNKMGITIFLISHDINLVSEYVKKIIFIKGGRVIYNGLTIDVINRNNIEDVFGIKDFFIEPNKLTGNLNLFFIPEKN